MLKWFKAILKALTDIAYELGNVNVWLKDIAGSGKRNSELLENFQGLDDSVTTMAESQLEMARRLSAVEELIASHTNSPRHSYKRREKQLEISGTPTN